MKRSDDVTLAHRLLDRCVFANLSMVDSSGAPYCVPISPAREENCLFFHCGLRGRKIDALRVHPQVCLTCVGEVQSLPGAFDLNFQSAVAFGVAEEIVDEGEKVHALELICKKYCPDDLWDLPRVLKGYFPATGIWKITLTEITTKG